MRKAVAWVLMIVGSGGAMSALIIAALDLACSDPTRSFSVEDLHAKLFAVSVTGGLVMLVAGGKLHSKRAADRAWACALMISGIVPLASGALMATLTRGHMGSDPLSSRLKVWGVETALIALGLCLILGGVYRLHKARLQEPNQNPSAR